MQLTYSKQKVAAVAAGLAIVGAVAASAASLGGLRSDALGADSGDVGSCDTDGIDVEYTHGFDADSGEYMVDSVTLSDIAFACLLRPYEVSVFEKGPGGAREVDGGPFLIFSIYNRSTDGGFEWAGRRTIELTEGFPAEDLDGISMYISGERVVP